MSKQIEELRKHLGSVNEEMDKIREYIEKIDSNRSKATRNGDYRRAADLFEAQKMVEDVRLRDRQILKLALESKIRKLEREKVPPPKEDHSMKYKMLECLTTRSDRCPECGEISGLESVNRTFSGTKNLRLSFHCTHCDNKYDKDWKV